jgi:prepilin-type N-terminal cleavage/methylation domain-containing protein
VRAREFTAWARHHDERGFTLIELLIVIVIIGVLATIVMFGVPRFRDDANLAADQTNLNTLNTASGTYAVSAGPGQGLSDLPNDTARMNRLFDRGLLVGDPSHVITAKVADAAFTWSASADQWLYTSGTTSTYDLASGGTPLSSFVRTGNWAQSASGLVSNYGLLFVSNPRSSYTITATATIMTSGILSGFGVLFNETLVGTVDTGYAVQLDRGMNGVVIRPRLGLATGNNEGSPVAQYYASNPGGLVHDRNTDPGWWTAPHTITIHVTSGTTTTADISLDGHVLFSGFSLPSPAPASRNNTGFRSWGGNVTFSALTVTGPTG